jgi:ribonuclease VapC
MNNKIVFDSSALLALLHQEAGYKNVEKYLPQGIISTVNLAEVVAILEEIGIAHSEAEKIVSELMSDIIVFDRSQAILTAQLRKSTKAHGLSLGDRACLSLAKSMNLPVLTADKAWVNADHSVKVLLIR